MDIEDLIHNLREYQSANEAIEKKASMMDAKLPFFQIWSVFDTYNKEKNYIISICHQDKVDMLTINSKEDMTVMDLIENHLKPIVEKANE